MKDLLHRHNLPPRNHTREKDRCSMAPMPSFGLLAPSLLQAHLLHRQSLPPSLRQLRQQSSTLGVYETRHLEPDTRDPRPEICMERKDLLLL